MVPQVRSRARKLFQELAYLDLFQEQFPGIAPRKFLTRHYQDQFQEAIPRELLGDCF
jgi:hypothetical protein